MPMYEVDGAELHVETVGSGPPVLLLHGGLGLDHTYFRPAFDQLADQATVIYYDHRGNGRSGGDVGALTLERLADDVVGVLDALGVETAAVLGHSYGGFIGQVAAIAHPERFTRLVFLNTVPAFDYQPMPSGTEEQVASWAKLFEGVPDDATWRQLWTAAQPLYYHRYDEAEAARIDAATTYVGEAWNTAAGLLGEFNTLAALPDVSVPTLAAGGRHDFITPPEQGPERIASLVPDAELAIFEGSGHYPFLEEPELFFPRLRGFLAG
ncbi:MAG: alpha/beta fold hydrolase [Actinomycetota bacterium]